MQFLSLLRLFRNHWCLLMLNKLFLLLLLFFLSLLFTFEIVLCEVATLTHTVGVMLFLLVCALYLSCRFTGSLNTALFSYDCFNLVNLVVFSFYIIFKLKLYLCWDILLNQGLNIVDFLWAFYFRVFCGGSIWLGHLVNLLALLGWLEQRTDLVLQRQILEYLLFKQIWDYVFLLLISAWLGILALN